MKELLDLSAIAEQTTMLKNAVEVLNAYITESERLTGLTSIYNRCVEKNRNLIPSSNDTSIHYLDTKVVEETRIEKDSTNLNSINYVMLESTDSKETIREKLISIYAANPGKNCFDLLRNKSCVYVFSNPCVWSNENLRIFNNQIEDAQVNFIFEWFRENNTCFDEEPSVSEKEGIFLKVLLSNKETCEITSLDSLNNILKRFREYYISNRCRLESRSLLLVETKCKRYYLTTEDSIEYKGNICKMGVVIKNRKYLTFKLNNLLEDNTFNEVFEESAIFANLKKESIEEIKPVEENKKTKEPRAKRISTVEIYNLTTIDPTTPERFTELLTDAGIFDKDGNYISNIKETKYIGLYQLNNNQLAFKLYNANEVRPKKVLSKHRKAVIEIFPYQLHLNKKNVKEEVLNTFKAFVSKCLPVIEEKKEALAA